MICRRRMRGHSGSTCQRPNLRHARPCLWTGLVLRGPDPTTAGPSGN
jgi:hypothetical protein